MYTVFKNSGLIDMRAVKTFGASVKETDNPIGMFGTGLKYSIAVSLRNGLSVTLLRGSAKPYKFTLQKSKFRGQEIETVAMNDNDLGYTSQVGKFWEPWMAFRELYCNCHDEPDAEVYLSEEFPEAEPGKTIVVVEGQLFEDLYYDRWQYFLKPNISKLHKGNRVEIYDGASKSVFYKRVRAHKLKPESIYTYNIISDSIELTEDRTVKYSFEVDAAIRNSIVTCENKEVIEKILTAPRGTYEHGIKYNDCYDAPSEEFLEVVEQLNACRNRDLNLTSLRLFFKFGGKKLEVQDSCELNVVERQQFERAVEFCKELGFPVDKYPIIVLEDLGQDVLGQAENKKILVAKRGFEMGGAKQVASILIEEFIHLEKGYADCTRSMQNYLFELLVSKGELLLGKAL